MGIRTIALKLHKPSKRKIRVIEEARDKYTKAYQYLLDRALEQEEYIEKEYMDERGSYRAAKISKWVDSRLVRELNRFDVEPFKDSLKIDFSMTMASYLCLKKVQGKVNFPVAYLSEFKWRSLNDQALLELEDGLADYAGYMKSMMKLSGKWEAQKPIFFCRCDTKRDFCLLYDEENKRYYAKLYLMNVRDENRCSLNTDTERELFYIHKSGGCLEKSKRQERFILFPLALGKWQEEYLEKARKSPDIIKTARLIKKKEEYYLSINIDIGEKEQIQTESYLGLSRGLGKLLNYTIVDMEGNVIKKSSFDKNLYPVKIKNNRSKKGNRSFKDDYKEININVIHKIANDIVESALKYKSQVIVQAFVDRGDKLRWKNKDNSVAAPPLNYHSYNRLLSILEYKLRGKGLPAQVKVSPVGIFYTCPKCGLHMAKNRSSKDIFICVECGTASDIESLGSLNMARKLIKYKKGLIKIKVEKNNGKIRFINRDLGMSFVPENPMDCFDEFNLEIKRLIDEFYIDINKMQRDKAFKRKYSLIKKIEQLEDLSGLIEMV